MLKNNFSRMYRPATANPFHSDQTCRSITPSVGLQPFVHCYWGSEIGFNPNRAELYAELLIIPDTCMDIIFIRNNDTGTIRRLFTGLDETYTIDRWDEKEQDVSVFAVRLFFWSFHYMKSFSLKGTLNGIMVPDDIFPGICDLSERIFEKTQFTERAALMEQFLKKMITGESLSDTFLNGCQIILRDHGAGTLAQLSEQLCYSKRQIQRVFMDKIGAGPKQLMNLVRYQNIWQELLHTGRVDYQNVVERYGYVDQSHFIADFKKHHSLTPGAALRSVYWG